MLKPVDCCHLSMENLCQNAPNPPIVVSRHEPRASENGASNGVTVVKILQRPRSLDNDLLTPTENDLRQTVECKQDGVATDNFDLKKKNYESARLRIFGTTDPVDVAKFLSNDAVSTTKGGILELHSTCYNESNKSKETNQEISHQQRQLCVTTTNDGIRNNSYTNSYGALLPQHHYPVVPQPILDKSSPGGYCNSLMQDGAIQLHHTVSTIPRCSVGNFVNCKNNDDHDYFDKQEQLISLVGQISRLSTRERRTERFIPNPQNQAIDCCYRSSVERYPACDACKEICYRSNVQVQRSLRPQALLPKQNIGHAMRSQNYHALRPHRYNINSGQGVAPHQSLGLNQITVCVSTALPMTQYQQNANYQQPVNYLYSVGGMHNQECFRQYAPAGNTGCVPMQRAPACQPNQYAPVAAYAINCSPTVVTGVYTTTTANYGFGNHPNGFRQ